MKAFVLLTIGALLLWATLTGRAVLLGQYVAYKAGLSTVNPLPGGA